MQLTNLKSTTTKRRPNPSMSKMLETKFKPKKSRISFPDTGKVHVPFFTPKYFIRKFDLKQSNTVQIKSYLPSNCSYNTSDPYSEVEKDAKDSNGIRAMYIS